MQPFDLLSADLLSAYVPALVAFFISLFVLGLFVKLIRNKARSFSDRTQSGFGDTLSYAVGKLNLLFVLGLALFIATKFIDLHDPWHTWVNSAIYVVMAFYLIRFAQTFLIYSVEKGFRSKDQNLSAGLKIVINLAIWLLGGALVLQHFGYDVSTLIAGMGIGGIAIAFAMQSILADIFASFSIYLDKPFEIGDSIMVGADQGTVRKIGIKSTRITTLQGEELVIPNSELTTARIHNFKQMDERRVVLKIGVVYETSVEKLKKAKEIIVSAITAQNHTRLERVHLSTLSNDQIIFEAAYYVETKDYLTFANANEGLIFFVLENFAKEGIQFAYPTQKVFVTREGLAD